MVELLAQKPQLAQSYHSGLHKVDTKEEWKEISTKLNCLGPPSRTGPEWMKVWADYKCNLKKKILHNKIELRATGGGSNTLYNLSAVEETHLRFHHQRMNIKQHSAFSIFYTYNKVFFKQFKFLFLFATNISLLL